MTPGFSEILRVEGFRKTPKAILSRGVAGMRKNTLIINLPGSPKAVRECLEIILDVIPHAVKMMRGGGH
jgi:molybdopterin biosynthesis enzyme MoaB